MQYRKDKPLTLTLGLDSYTDKFLEIPLWIIIIKSYCRHVLCCLLGIMMGISCLYSSVGWYRTTYRGNTHK